MLENIPKKIPIFFECNSCNYNTCSKKDFKKHIQTIKHNRLVNASNMLVEETSNKTFICCCGKSYCHDSSYYRHKKTCNTLVENKEDNSGLWRHRQKCNNEKKISDNEYDNNIYQGINIKDKDALVLHLLQQNYQLQHKIIEIASQSTITNNNTNTNSHNTTNNAFNLQFFLNDTCQNAMNITDFVSSIQFNLEDLENTGRTGYIEGISNIILKNLNQLNVTDRPIHCSDIKREVLYIKDNNEWQKETEHKPILTKAIKTIANENIKQISKWKDNYPDCIKSDSKKNDLYLKIVSNSMNGLTKEESDKNINKIITNVAKNVIIEK